MKKLTLSLIAFLCSFSIFPDHDIPSVIVGCEISYPPYSITNEKKEATGFSVELLNAALKVMDIEYTYVVDIWDKVKKDLETGAIDVLPVVGKTPEREHLFDFTFPYLTMHGAFVVNNSSSVPRDIGDIKNKKVAVMKGDNAEEYLNSLSINFDKILTDTFEDALFLLENEKVDIVLMQNLLAHQLIEQNEFKNIKVSKTIIQDFKQSFSFAVTEGNSLLLEKLNEGLSIVIADGTFLNLYNKWFSTSDRYRKKGDLIIVGGDDNYPPYEYIDENGDPAGFNVELTKAIAKEMNLNVHIELGSWTTVLNKMYSEEIDMIQGLFYSEERDRDLTFSQPHSVVKHVIVRKKSKPEIYDSQELNGLDVVVMKDDIMEEYLKTEPNLKCNIIEAINYEDALKKLSKGIGDYALLAQFPSNYWIKHNKIGNLSVGSYSILSPDYSYGSLDKNSNLILTFNEGLSNLKATGEYRDIYTKWFGIDSNTKMVVLYVLIPLALVIFVILLWTKSLNHQIKIKTKELYRSEKLLESVIDNITSAIIVIDENGSILHFNKQLDEKANFTGRALKNQNYLVIPFLSNINSEDFFKSDIYVNEVNFINRDGIKSWVHITIKKLDPILFGKPAVIVTATDITQLIKQQDLNSFLQKQLLHKSKMDAIGQLAGGIAHDFNNILNGIVNASQLIELNYSKGSSEVVKYTQLIQKASTHGSELVKKLLTFSGDKVEDEKSVDVHKLIYEAEAILKDTSDKKITISLSLKASLFSVFGNESAIYSSIMNICLNALHSMKNGGKLDIQTNNVILSESECNRNDFEVSPGNFLEIMIKDTGHGIPEENIQKIFEPFFTTKNQGEGTGLGLSAVYNTIKTLRGIIDVHSQVDKGTVFTLKIPAHLHNKQRSFVIDSIKNGSGLILFVDDEEINRFLGKQILESLGYNVILAEDGNCAIEEYRLHRDRISIVILDFMMPVMNGKDAFFKLKEINENVKVILSSGYSDSKDIEIMKQHGLDAIIHKPYKMEELSNILNKLLTT